MARLNPRSFAFRKQLRQSMETLDWQNCFWARNVLAAECIQGWAGRKQYNEAAIVTVYLKKKPTIEALRQMTTFFLHAGLPPFVLLPLTWNSYCLSQNRIPANDTQDRFWLLRGRNSLSHRHWDHWVLIPSTWGQLFIPTEQECLTIFNDDYLFNQMIVADWNYTENYGYPGSLWKDCVQKCHTILPHYAAALELLSSYELSEGYTAAHQELRRRFFQIESIDSFPLP